MPGGDRRGPRGEGPLTGRGAGYCAGYPVPGYASPPWGGGAVWGPGRGRGWGRGGGGGRGWGRGGRGCGWGWGHRHGYYATEWGGWGPVIDGQRADELELQGLKQEAARLEQVLDGMKARMQELEQENDSGKDM